MCGALSRCLLPLQPTTLPGLTLPPPHSPLPPLVSSASRYNLPSAPPASHFSLPHRVGCCVSTRCARCSPETLFCSLPKVCEVFSCLQRDVICGDKHNLLTSAQARQAGSLTKLCRPIPYGPNYPVIQESFLLSPPPSPCVARAGVKVLACLRWFMLMLLLLKQAGM